MEHLISFSESGTIPHSERQLILKLYREFFHILFSNSKFLLAYEFELVLTTKDEATVYFIDNTYPFRRAVIQRKELQDLVIGLPGFLVEIQKDDLVPNKLHKDFSKLAVAMTKILLARVKLVLTPETIEEAKKLKLFGILAGGTWLEFVMAQPLIGGFDSEGTADIGIVFQSSIDHARFPLFKSNKFSFDEENAGEIFGEASHQNFPVLNLVKAGPRLTRPNSNRNPETEREKLFLEKRETPIESAEIITCRAIERFFNSFVEHEEKFLKMLDNIHLPPKDDDKDFVFNGRLADLIPRASTPSGGSPNKSKYPKNRDTPKKEKTTTKLGRLHGPQLAFLDDSDVEMQSISDSSIEFKVPRYRFDELGQELVTIRKRFNPFELEIYQHSAIKSCQFFAKMVEYYHSEEKEEGEDDSESDDDTLTISLEALSCSLSEIDEIFDREIISNNLYNWLASGLLLGAMSALETLHSAGYVHSDLSPGNVCFSEKEGIWKLIDFNQSLPIEESLITQRRFGTPLFVSLRAEKRHILEPVDDYVALAKVVAKGFPEDWYYVVELRDDLIGLLEDMVRAEKIDSNWRQRAVIIHQESCVNAGKTEDQTLKLLNIKCK